jgi:hypothetical protein
MVERNIQRWDEMWVAQDGAASEPRLDSDQDNGPVSWEATVNAALARMLEGNDSVERAIAARLLLAESYLARLYHGGADEVVFAPGAEDE